MTSKKVLSFEQRMKILEDLEITPNIARVAAYHQLHPATVHRIKKNASNIAQYAQDELQKKRRRIRKPTFEALEEQLYSWYIERKTLKDVLLSDALLLEKAAELKETMPSYSNFKISRGWLHNFKKRNGIRLKHGWPEKMAANESEAQKFTSEFKKFIDEEDIKLECVYNIVETRLLWKALPMKSTIGVADKHVIDDKMKKAKVSIALCANATGAHKLKPFLIHKFRKPTALNHSQDNLPVVFAFKKNSSMDIVLFTEWFNYFKKSVETYQLQNGLLEKVILLVDNDMSHNIPLKCMEHQNIEIKFLPSNTTSFIQPMDQGIIEKTKASFRRILMQRIAKCKGGAEEFYKMYRIKSCINILGEAWDEITQNDVKNAWKKMIPHITETTNADDDEDLKEDDEDDNEEDEDFKEEIEEDDNTIAEMQQIMTQISGQDITSKDVITFLKVCAERERKPSVEWDKDSCENRNEDTDDDKDEDRDEDRIEDWIEIKDEPKHESNDVVTGIDCNVASNVASNVTSNVVSNENRVENRNEVWIEVKDEVMYDSSTEHGDIDRNDPWIDVWDDFKYEMDNDNKAEDRNAVGTENRVDNAKKNRNEVLRDRGIRLNNEERREVEDLFRRLEKFNHRVPRSIQLQLQALKLLYLGDTSTN